MASMVPEPVAKSNGIASRGPNTSADGRQNVTLPVLQRAVGPAHPALPGRRCDVSNNAPGNAHFIRENEAVKRLGVLRSQR